MAIASQKDTYVKEQKSSFNVYKCNKKCGDNYIENSTAHAAWKWPEVSLLRRS